MATTNEAQVENSEVTEVADVNAAAAKEISEHSDTSSNENNETRTSDTPVKPTDKSGKTETIVFDAQKQYDDLDKRYKDLQGGFTRTAQERAELRKELEVIKSEQTKLLQAFAKATEKPFDVEQFKRDFEKDGPKALDSYFKSKLEAQIAKERDEWTKKHGELETKYNEASTENGGLKAQLAVFVRVNNEKDYPNFVDLYPKILELAKNPETKMDFTRDINMVLDDLYKLAKERSSEEAVKIATAKGRQQAESELARESRTTVAGSGKVASTQNPDLEHMPMDKLEALVTQLHGVADRD